MNQFGDAFARDTDLSFAIQTLDGQTIGSIRDAAELFANLSNDDRQKNHWRVAIRMLDAAIREPAYLKTATMSLQTALAMDARIDRMQG
jgi:hypothetical protein